MTSDVPSDVTSAGSTSGVSAGTSPGAPVTPPSFTVLAVPGVPEVRAGDDLGQLLHDALVRSGISLAPGDVVVVASKILAKADGLRVHTSRDEAIAAETVRVVAERRAGERVTRIVEAAAGPVMAAAGVDESNVGGDGGVLLLPRGSDARAANLLRDLRRRLSWPDDQPLGLIVSDTAGRPWRGGVVDFALGSAGVQVLDDHRGGHDADGRELSVTIIAVADAMAAAADLVKGKSGSLPVAIVRGLPYASTDPDLQGASTLVRTGPGDWFRSGPVEAVREALGVAAGSALSEEIGIRSVSLEDVPTRARRAIDLALHPLRPDVAGTVTGTPAEVTVRIEASDAYLLGQAVARLHVALASEDLVVTDEQRNASVVDVRVTDR